MYRNILLKKYFKFFSIAFYLFFFVSTVLIVPTNIAFAQTTGDVQTSSSTPKIEALASNDIYYCLPKFVGGYGLDGLKCVGGIFNAILSSLFSFIYYALVYPLSIVASFVFDFTVYFSVVHFRDNFSELQMGGVGNFLAGGANVGFIYYLWGIIRDVLNIIIFIMINYHAVRSMFEGFEGTKSKFIALLVFSIITNFSLLLVKLAIDVSNILTLQAYTLGVKPSGTDSFTAFRTSTGNAPANYGEFIRNSIDLDKLVTNNSAPDAAKAEVENMQNTFMFQLGRLITMTGVIYLLLFMTGLLLARALSFLFAMILSPLLAADIFFTMIAKTNPLVKDVQEGISGITKKIKGDFYDALAKGPLLIFFVFLIGLFAESMMSTGLMNTMNDSFKSSNPSNVPGIIGQNLFVFFKFALFFLLTRKALEILQGVSFGGTWVNNWGKKFANATLGRTAGLGLAGLANLGRAATFGRARFAGLNEDRYRRDIGVSTDVLKNKNSNFLQKAIARGVINRSQKGLDKIDRLKTQTGDFRNTGAFTSLSKSIENAIGMNIAKEAGPGSKLGLKATEEDRVKKDKARDEALINAMVNGYEHKFSDSEKSDINKAKGFVGGKELSVEQMDEISKNISTYKSNINNGIESDVKGKKISATDMKAILDGDEFGSLDEVLRVTKEAKEKEITKKGKDKFKEKVTAEKVKYQVNPVANSLTMVGRASNSERREEYIKANIKSVKEKAKSDAAKKVRTSLQTEEISNGLIPNANNIIKEINESLSSASPTQRVVLEDSLKTLGSLSSFVPDEKNIPEFNKEKFNGIKEAKDKALKMLQNIYENNPPPGMSSGDLGRKKSLILGLKKKTKTSTQEYARTIPKDEKSDSGAHGKDKKDSGGDKDKKEKGSEDKPKKDDAAH